MTLRVYAWWFKLLNSNELDSFSIVSQRVLAAVYWANLIVNWPGLLDWFNLALLLSSHWLIAIHCEAATAILWSRSQGMLCGGCWTESTSLPVHRRAVRGSADREGPLCKQIKVWTCGPHRHWHVCFGGIDRGTCACRNEETRKRDTEFASTHRNEAQAFGTFLFVLFSTAYGGLWT